MNKMFWILDDYWRCDHRQQFFCFMYPCIFLTKISALVLFQKKLSYLFFLASVVWSDCSWHLAIESQVCTALSGDKAYYESSPSSMVLIHFEAWIAIPPAVTCIVQPLCLLSLSFSLSVSLSHTHTNTHTHTQTHIQTHTECICIHACVCIYTYIYIYIYVCMDMGVYTCLHIYIYM